MHKIDGAGHLNNLFVMEDALLNRPPTEITADFMNAIQQELVNVIVWAGIGLNKSDNTQLLQALQAKFAVLDPGGDYATKSAVQFDDYKIADASVVGSADAIVADFFPVPATLSHGMTLFVRASASNTLTNPTFTPSNGLIAAKTIVKGANLPLAAGDISGAGYWASLRFDLTLDKWVLLNPATGILPVVGDVGFVKAYAGTGVPAGYLACPVAPADLSRAVYADLFAAIGTAWGVGDGSSTFGMPWVPENYTLVQAGVAAVGSATVGEVIAHTHAYYKNAATGAGGGAYSGIETLSTTVSTGGPANLAAGHRFKFCIKY